MESDFFGREKELESAFEVFSQVISGHGSLLFISGPAGIGKTRFVEEIIRRAERTGIKIITGHCTSQAKIPYAPLVQAFSSLKVESPFNVKSEGGYNSPFVSPQEMLFPTLTTISKASYKEPLVIHIEDLQWADTPTIDLIQLMARSIGGLKILIIATYRAEDMVPESGIENAYFLNTLSVMKRAKLFLEIALDPLRPKDLKRIAHSIIDGNLETTTVRELNKLVEGNPLLFIEMIRYLSEKKLLNAVEGHWELVNGYNKEMPPSLIGFELQKYNILTSTQKRVIEYASVIGEWFDLDLLSNSLGVEKHKLLEVLTSLSDHSCFIKSTEQRYHFEHQIAQQAVYQNIPLEQRAEMHQRLAETIESMEITSLPNSVLSDHYYFAGNREKALEFSIKAAEACLKASFSDDGLIYLKRAESLIRSTDDSKTRIRLYEYLGDAYFEIGEDSKADNYYLKCLPMISETSIDRARLLRKRAGCWYPLGLGKGDLSESVRLIEEAERCIGLQTIDHAEIEVFRGFADFLDHDFEKAKLHYKNAIGLFKASGILEREINSKRELAEIFVSEGDLPGALSLLEEANGHILADRMWKMRMDLSFDRGVIYWHMGNLEKAFQEYGHSLEIANKICHYQMIVVANQYECLIHIELGDFQKAELCLNNCLDCLDLVKIDTLHARTLAILAHVQLMQNQVNEAKGLLAESIEEISDFSSPLNITSGMVKLVEAELMLSLGQTSASRSQFNLAIELLQKSVYGVMFESVGFSWYAEILKKYGYQKEAQECLEKAYSKFSRIGNVRIQNSGQYTNI